MSNLKFDDDVEKILNEVDNYEIDENDEGDNESVDVDALLNEDLEGEEEEVKEVPTRRASVFPDSGDPLNLLEVPKPRKEEKPIVQKIVHPFEALEEKERDISAKLGGQHNLDSKFVVTNFERTMKKKFPNVTYEVLETISNHCFPSEHSHSVPTREGEEEEEDTNYWGSPKCLAIIPEKYIAFGTSNAAAFVYTYETSDIKRFGTVKEQPFGAVTAIDVSLREEGLLCGYESGHIVLWGIIRGDQIKVIVPAEKSPVLSLRFWKETKTNFISSNSKGVVQLYTLTSSFFQWNVEKRVLINQSDADKKPGGPPDPVAHLPNGFLSIQVLRRDLTRHHPLNKYTVVALASMKMIIIITLEPVVGSVYKYVRPTGLSDLTVPSISWGKCALPGQDENRHPVLAMSWGNEITLLQCQNVEEEEGNGIKFAGYYNNSTNEIFHIDWISESNLLVYDYTREFKILNVEKFNATNPNGKNDKFNYAAAVVSSQPLDPDISFQVYTNDKTDLVRGQRPIIYYDNTIVANQAARRVFVLGYKKMYVGRHFEWKEHIQDFANKDEWLPAFGLFMSIYKGNNKTFAGLPIRAEERKEALMTYGAQLVREYVTYIHDKHGPPELTTINKLWKPEVFTIIDFLVSTENFAFLLKETRRIFENFGLQDLFMECLEAFILRNRITSIPNEPFKDVVKYYTEREKIDVLQYLIINIDLQHIDIDFAITLCMEYNLLTALFYLCSHKEGGEGADFLTPIARALSIYQISVERGEVENQEYGLKFLWFIHMLLHGKLFPQGIIPDDIWQEKVKDVIILLFDEMHLGLMLHIDPYVSFEIFKALFEPKLAAMIESYDQNSIHIISEIDKINSRSRESNAGNTELRFAADQFAASISNGIQADMLALIYHCGKKKDKNGKNQRNLTYYTMATLAIKYEYNIPDNIMQESLFYILDNARDLAKWEQGLTKIEDEDGEEVDTMAIERNDLILGLMKKLEGKLEIEDLQRIKKKMDLSEFLDVKTYLIALEGNYKTCFRLYLDQTSSNAQKKVFLWLNNVIRSVKSQQPTKLNQLKKAIFNEFCELVSIDNEKARQVILNLDPTCEPEAVATLKGSPRLQLNYLNSVLEYQHKDYQIPDELLILHMRLLCQLYPKEVLEEINKHAYPLDECLKLCQEYNVRNGVAFFLERAGKLMEALNITLELFQKSLEKKLRKIEETNLFHEEGLTRKFQNAKEICRKNTTIGDSESEKLWFRIFDKIVEGYLTHIINNKAVKKALKSDVEDLKTDCYKRFAAVYSDYVSDLFASISQNVSVESIADKLRDYQHLKLADLRQPLLIMLTGYYGDEALAKDTKNMVFQDTAGKIEHWFNKRIQGVGSGGVDIDPDLVDKMIVFDCGHSFPRSYVQDTRCLTCLEDENVQVENLVSNIGILKQRQKTLSESGLASTASISPTQISPLRVETTMPTTEPAHEIISSKPPAFDPKEKYLRKLLIVDDRMIDSSEHWEDFEDIPKDPFNL